VIDLIAAIARGCGLQAEPLSVGRKVGFGVFSPEGKLTEVAQVLFRRTNHRWASNGARMAVCARLALAWLTVRMRWTGGWGLTLRRDSLRGRVARRNIADDTQREKR